jgi:hypothetical protein
VARSSLHETETLLTVAVRRRFLSADAEPAFKLSREVSSILIVLRRRLLASKNARKRES